MKLEKANKTKKQQLTEIYRYPLKMHPGAGGGTFSFCGFEASLCRPSQDKHS